MPDSLSPPSKRRFSPSDLYEEDTENVDPSFFGSHKRAKNIDGSHQSPVSKVIATPSKMSNFVLTDAPQSPNDLTNSIKPSPLSVSTRSAHVSASRLGNAHQILKAQGPSSTKSTPGAGRSPKSKRFGILSRRRTSSPFTRIDPPIHRHNASPMSLDAALSGTIPTYAPHQTRQRADQPIQSLDEQPTKAGWFFDIHEDTAEETLTNIMEFSTGALDISDDEERRREKDDRGKENIPPGADDTASAPAPAPRPAPITRTKALHRTRSTKSDRSPLADLSPEDFYDVPTTPTSTVPSSKTFVLEDSKKPAFATPPNHRADAAASTPGARSERGETSSLE
ncbi:MAG: hypothetical protein M1833_004641 [Piccolia ochrophora]|nr:MAG: hypothetical protein M1833_004641 [Piccolia ochrophora]